MNVHSVYTTGDTRYVSDVSIPLTQSHVDFIDLIRSHGYLELSRSLRMIHDLALYHSDIPFDTIEKVALFDLKVIWEGLDKLKENT